MKGDRKLKLISNITFLLIFLSSSLLFAQEDIPDQPQFLELGNKTFIQINNVLVQGDKVSLKLGENTYANLTKLMVLDSVASFYNPHEDTFLAKAPPEIEDVIVLTKYISKEEITQTTIKISPLQVELEDAFVADNDNTTEDMSGSSGGYPAPAIIVAADDDITTEDMFGSRGGYLHPYLSYRGEYSDNVYNINVDERANLLSIFSGGMWVGVPRIKELPLTLSSHNSSVGGMRYSSVGSGAFTRFQTYLLAGLDHKMYSEDSELDYSAWRIEGMYQQNLPAGISIRIAEKYSRDRDRYDQGSFLPTDFTIDQGNTRLTSKPSLIRDYSSNLALASINLDMSERFSGQFDYSNFWLDYDENDDNWLDRTDNMFSVSMSYKHSPKTSVFIEYKHGVISYQTDESNDSEDTFLGSGIRWRSSAKTSLMIKGGYQNKEYTSIDEDTHGVFSMEGNLDYLITDKTKIGFKLNKALEETDSLQNRGRDTIAAQLRYDQQFSYKLQGNVEFRYENNDYDGFQRTENNIPNQEPRQDTRFLVRPGIQYFFRDWLMSELAYSFENRNSNDNFYDFTTQTVFFSLNGAF